MNKEIEIFVNSQPKIVEKRDYSYEEIVTIALGMYDDATYDYTMTVTMKNDEGDKHSKSFSKGDVIKMKEGMRISVDSTYRS